MKSPLTSAMGIDFDWFKSPKFLQIIDLLYPIKHNLQSPTLRSGNSRGILQTPENLLLTNENAVQLKTDISKFTSTGNSAASSRLTLEVKQLPRVPIKVCLLGEAGVGKTTLLSHLTLEKATTMMTTSAPGTAPPHSPCVSPTMGLQVGHVFWPGLALLPNAATSNVNHATLASSSVGAAATAAATSHAIHRSPVLFDIELWDCAFSQLSDFGQSLTVDADAAIFVFSVTDQSSFDMLPNMIRQSPIANSVGIVVAMKNDLVAKTEVSMRRIVQFENDIKRNNLLFVEPPKTIENDGAVDVEKSTNKNISPHKRVSFVHRLTYRYVYDKNYKFSYQNDIDQIGLIFNSICNQVLCSRRTSKLLDYCNY